MRDQDLLDAMKIFFVFLSSVVSPVSCIGPQPIGLLCTLKKNVNVLGLYTRINSELIKKSGC